MFDLQDNTVVQVINTMAQHLNNDLSDHLDMLQSDFFFNIFALHPVSEVFKLHQKLLKILN